MLQNNFISQSMNNFCKEKYEIGVTNLFGFGFQWNKFNSLQVIAMNKGDTITASPSTSHITVSQFAVVEGAKNTQKCWKSILKQKSNKQQILTFQTIYT